jgi:hypothetical protein
VRVADDVLGILERLDDAERVVEGAVSDACLAATAARRAVLLRELCST